MKLEITAARLAERPVSLRLPFKFGSTVVGNTAEAYVAVTVRVDGAEVTGKAAQLMVPRWFDKRAGRSNEETVDDLRRVCRLACESAPGRAGSVADLSAELRGAVLEAAGDLPPLAAGFGPALLEMALIDAACLAAGVPFWKGAKGDLFGLVARCPGDLSPGALRASLGRIEAPSRIALRHTVGFDAPLRRAEAEGPDDGLPVSVEEVAEATGISAWKIKLTGQPDADLARLRDIAGLLDEGPEYSATLDANEQYDPADFPALLSGLSHPALERLRGAVRFVEQPFDRAVALETEAGGYGVPLVIDESDAWDEAFVEALARGWAGTSIKSCKGVLRALLNRARAEAAGALLSGEDLTVQPGLGWRQDTAMMAACGVRDVERNGHHFAGGMQGAPEAEIAATLETFPGIFREGANGRPALRIEGGGVEIAELDRPGFGGSDAVGALSQDD